MATGFPTKANWVSGDILTAAQMDDLAGTVNALSNAAATSGSVLVSNVAGTSFAYQPLQAAGKNAVINGGMDIWQRGTSVAIAASSGVTYTADRWCTFSGANQALTISRQATADTTNLPNIQYCARYQRNSGQTGTSVLYFAQSLETVNSIAFAGKQVTVSFYVRAGANFSPASGNLVAIVYSGTGTDQNVLTSYTGQTTVASTATNLTTTWQRISITGTVAVTATELSLSFNMTPVGTAGANDYFEITGVQVELGSTATTFSRAGGSIGGELALCQRYYWRQNWDAQTTYAIFGQGSAASTTIAYCQTPYPVQMRVKPTAIDFPTVGTYFQCLDAASGGATMTALSFDASQTTSSMGFLSATVAAGLTQYRPYVIRGLNSTAAYLGWSAEL